MEAISTIFSLKSEQIRLSTLYIYKHINILEAGFPCFYRQAKAKNSQANGLYVLVGFVLT